MTRLLLKNSCTSDELHLFQNIQVSPQLTGSMVVKTDEERRANRVKEKIKSKGWSDWTSTLKSGK